MKSKRIIHLLFLVIGICNLNAKTYLSDPDSFMKETQVDSLYATYSEQKVTEKNASLVVAWYNKKINQNTNLTSSDHKRIGLSYGYLGNAQQAKLYIEKYIKGTYDIAILDDTSLQNIKTSKEYKSLVSSYKPKIDGWILFFMASGIIGLFIALVLNMRKKGDMIANLLIGLFVLCHSLFLIHLSLYLTNYIFYLPNSYWATITFSFLYGPLLYFYFKRISDKHTFKWVDVLHLIPTVAIVIYFIPIYALSPEIKQFKIFNVDQDFASTLNVIVFIKAVSLLVYGFLTFRIYLKNSKKPSKIGSEIIKWQRNMSALNLLYAVTYVIYAIVLVTHVVFMRDNNFMLYSQVIMLACIVLYVGYTAYVSPRVFSKKYLFAEESHKYKKSGLTENFSNDLKAQLLALLNEGKIYKMNTISLDILAEKLGTTRHNISQVINEHFDVNFFNLINKYRIQEAQEIFRNDLHNNLNIIDVAYDVGFNNKVTFNKAFKEETGLTPTQYIKKVNGIDLATSA